AMYSNPVTISKDFFRTCRDDLYPFLGGGNKGRKMAAIAQDIFRAKANAVVTTGGIQSNHCRAGAVFAGQHRMQCTVVLHGSTADFQQPSANAKVMRLSGSTIVFAEHPRQIGELMDEAMNDYVRKGLDPYYSWGGGPPLEGGKAY